MTKRPFRQAVDELIDLYNSIEGGPTHIRPKTVESEERNIVTAERFLAHRIFQVRQQDFQHETGPGIFYSLPPTAARLLQSLANQDPKYFDVAIDICCTNVLGGNPVPIGLRGFVEDVLKKRISRPTPPHRESKLDFLRLRTIYWDVKYLEKRFGLTITRNDVSEQTSASDAVADALTEIGYPTKYSFVKDLMVHPRHERTRRVITRVEEIQKINWDEVDWEIEREINEVFAQMRSLKEVET